MAFGISGEGRSAEEQFILITGAARAQRAASGDAILDGHLIEVKKATSNTLNQVRAVKYLPIVVLYEPTRSWYVIPAHRVVARVARKNRGQHTENPFESATLSLADFGDTIVNDVSGLRDATLAAVAESDSYQELRDAMAEILKDARTLSEVSKEKIRALLKRLGFA